jgi:hypothetical protein
MLVHEHDLVVGQYVHGLAHVFSGLHATQNVAVLAAIKWVDAANYEHNA